ncbi:hypothetical protein FK216_14690 [Moraxellaceae bacterium AER2_44_116]|nr:hypothetical protein FK216_14690 [Moraxellaceae bacterium AER2_44_116]
MSANRKSVFLSDHALDILGPFSSGRLNGIIEKYGYLIQTQELDATFSPSDLALIYQVTKEKATQERESWKEFTATGLEKLLNAVKTTANSHNIEALITRIYRLNPLQEIALIEAIERYWAEERVRLFKAYQERKKQP